MAKRLPGRMALTHAQIEALTQLDGYRITPVAAMVAFGAQWRRTFDSLSCKGLLRHYPYGASGQGTYGLSRDGQELVDGFVRAAGEK